MKKTINFRGLQKISLIVAAALVVIGTVMHIIFGGHTFAAYSFANLGIGFYLKAVVAAVLVLALVLIYFLIRFKKAGVAMALFSTLGAVINALVAFALTVICRANLGDITFALMLFAVILSYITFVVFGYIFSAKKTVRKKKGEPEADNYNESANKTFATMLSVLVVIVLVLVATFVVAAVFGAKVLVLYALPAILTAVFSVFFTVAFTCRLFADKA